MRLVHEPPPLAGEHGRHKTAPAPADARAVSETTLSYFFRRVLQGAPSGICRVGEAVPAEDVRPQTIREPRVLRELHRLWRGGPLHCCRGRGGGPLRRPRAARCSPRVARRCFHRTNESACEFQTRVSSLVGSLRAKSGGATGSGAPGRSAARPRSPPAGCVSWYFAGRAPGAFRPRLPSHALISRSGLGGADRRTAAEEF